MNYNNNNNINNNLKLNYNKVSVSDPVSNMLYERWFECGEFARQPQRAVLCFMDEYKNNATNPDLTVTNGAPGTHIVGAPYSYHI